MLRTGIGVAALLWSWGALAADVGGVKAMQADLGNAMRGG